MSVHLCLCALPQDFLNCFRVVGGVALLVPWAGRWICPRAVLFGRSVMMTHVGRMKADGGYCGMRCSLKGQIIKCIRRTVLNSAVHGETSALRREAMKPLVFMALNSLCVTLLCAAGLSAACQNFTLWLPISSCPGLSAWKCLM